jgi:DNA-binding IclR family transcriptional regulator
MNDRDLGGILRVLPGDEASPRKGAAAAKSVATVSVKPVVNAVRILRHLSQSGTPERAVDVARTLGINPSTCFNILRTLVAEDVLDFDALSKTYTAGLGMARLAQQMVTQGHRLELARAPMQATAARFKVTVTLWRRLGDDRIVLMATECSPTDLRIEMVHGQRLPVLMGASGRLFAGHMGLSEDAVREVFSGIRWARPLTFDTYWREVNRAKRRGFAVDDGYFASGIVAIAAPVLNGAGDIAYTVSAVTFRNHHDEAGLEAIGLGLKELAADLESVLF